MATSGDQDSTLGSLSGTQPEIPAATTDAESPTSVNGDQVLENELLVPYLYSSPLRTTLETTPIRHLETMMMRCMSPHHS